VTGKHITFLRAKKIIITFLKTSVKNFKKSTAKSQLKFNKNSKNNKKCPYITQRNP